MARLLLVDDELPVLGILKDMLSLVGHTVIATHDGNEALHLIEAGDFDLVITDLVMPNISGWDIANRLKRKFPTIPVILLTGWAAGYENENLSQRGVDLLLAKPVTLKTLSQAIEGLISNPLQKPVPV